MTFSPQFVQRLRVQLRHVRLTSRFGWISRWFVVGPYLCLCLGLRLGKLLL